jgi:hypothetical protein
MRNSNLLKVQFLVFLLIAFGLSVQAKSVYLSSTGSDTNSGLVENSPVATLTKAFSLSADGDVIFVNGIIDLSKEITNPEGFDFPDKQVTIDGKDKSQSGFTGNGRVRIFSIQDNNKGVVVKNLTLTNGSSLVSVGGLVYVFNSDIQFENCEFSETTARMAEGGAIYLLNAKKFTLKNCTIKNCTADEGGAIFITADDAIAQDLTSTIHIEACLIADNTAEIGGAAISVHNADGNIIKLTIVNSTIYNNLSGNLSTSGAIAFNGSETGSSVNFTNCTIVKNRTGNPGTRGAGINFISGTNNLVKGIYNCIIESNTDAGVGQRTDIAFRDVPENEKNFFLYHSYVGGIFVRNSTYEPIPKNNNRLDYLSSELAELATPHNDYVALQNSIPLQYNASALMHGNAQYLKNLGIAADQNGNERKFENNKCAVGAVEKAADRPVGIEPQVFQHFIMYGQSLSTGHEAYPVSTENIEGNYMIGEQIWINYGNRNLDQLTPLRAAKAISVFELSEVALHGMVNHLRLKQQAEFPEIENKFIATSAGSSGQSIEDLSKESQIYNFYGDFQNALRYGKRNITSLNSDISVPAIFWLQGEWNYHEGTTNATGLTPGSKATNNKDTYKQLMIQLKRNMQADIQERYLQKDKPLFITYQVGAQYTRGMRLPIGMAQLEASNEYEDVICAGPVYQMTDFGGHLDGNGYRWYGEMLGKVYYKTKILGEDFKPLQPKRLEKDPNDLKKIHVTFHVPEPPLVFDTNILKKENNFGFNLYMRGRALTITSLEIVNDTIVTLTTNENLTDGIIAVSYASNNTRGHGNLRDSDPWQAFFNYEFPDKKSPEGQFPDRNDPNGMKFVFDHFYDPVNERPDGFGPRYRATLVPPSGEPLGEDGKPIYDQPYPLYNFSVAFYYEIPIGESNYEVPNMKGEYVSIPTVKKDEISVGQAGKSLYITLPESGNVSIELFDISGKKIKQFDNSYQLAQERKEYSLQSASSGVYIIRVITPNKTQSSKVIL